MKKIHMMIAALLAFLPTMLFAGGSSTTYYAALKAQVSSSGGGKVYAGTSNSAPSASSYKADYLQSNNQSSTTENESKNFYAFASADEGYEFSHWSTSNGGTSASAANPYTVAVKCSSSTESSPTLTTVYAVFKKKTLAAFGITFNTSSAGSYTVDGAAPANKTGLTEATSVVLKSTDANFLNWLVNGTVVSANPYTVNCLADTTISAEFLTADQVTSVTTISDLTAALSNAAYKKIIVPSGTTLTVAKGSTVTVPAGKQLVVDGTLNVIGTVSNSGAISGSGTLYKISYLIDQGENELQVLCAPDGSEYGKISNTTYHSGESSKYYKTKVSSNTPSVGGTVSVSTTSWGVLLNGKDVYAISAQTLKGVQVSLDNTVAANKISGIVGSLTTTDISSGETSGKKNWLLFADCNLKGPVRSDATNRLNFNGTIDLGGHKLTFGQPRTYSDFYGMFLNGTIDFQPSTDFQNGGAIFFNCAPITVKKIKGTPTMLFYDCGTSSSASTLTFNYQSGAHRNARFYNGYYSYSFNTSYDNNYAKVYGGSFTSDPSSYLADIDKLEAVKSGNYFVVQEKKEVLNVVQIGSTPYESLDAAISAAANSSTISLIEAVELTGTTTIPAGKSITVALDGHTLTGGKIVNNGTLVFTDSTTGKGTAANEASGGTVESDIENNGTLDFVFGKYTGAIVNKAGTLTTHNGLFTGTFEKQGGTVNLRGGHFSADVEELATLEGTKVFFGNSLYSVCELPNGEMYSETLTGAAGYGVTPYSDDDFALVKGWFGNKNARTSYTAAEWTRLAELLCFYQLFNNNGLDATLAFDRDVNKGSLNFYAKSSLTLPVDLKFDLAAGQYYRALSETLIGNGYYAKTYKALWDDNIKSVAMAATDKSGNNAGTVCTAMVELWESVRASDYSSTGRKETNTVFIAGSKRFTIGAGANKAMIRPETGAATFYPTIADAAAAANGATVMLTQDCNDGVAFASVGTFNIDKNGFALTGNITADIADGAEYFVDTKAEGDVLVCTVAKKAIQVGDQMYGSIQEVVEAAGEQEQGEVTVNITEDTLVQDVEMTLGVKTIKVVVPVTSGTVINVKPPENHFVEVTVVEPQAGEQSGAATTETVYEAKKITEEVATVTEATASTVTVETKEESGVITTVEEPAKVVEVVNNLMENKALERADNTAQEKLEVLEKIEIKPVAVVQEVAAGESKPVVTAATFDVTPKDADAQKINGTEFTFRLPIADGLSGSVVVFHEKVFFGNYPVLSWNDGAKVHKYIEVTSSEFSEYSYELLTEQNGAEYAVATIGENGFYGSLAEAFAAASNGDTVVLQKDTTLSDEIAVAKTVTLDLNGHTAAAADGKSAIQVAGGALTIDDTVGGGGITAANGCYAVYTDFANYPVAKAVTINGGTFSSVRFNKYPIQTTAVQSGEARTPTTVAVNGGTFTGGFSIYRCPTTIAGGTFEKGLDTSVGSVSVYSNSKTPVNIAGGKFKTEPINVGGRVIVAAGYYEGGWYYVNKDVVCQAVRNGKNYRYASEAFAVVGADTKIALIGDVDLSGISVTLGEGQSLTVSSSLGDGWISAADGLTLVETPNSDYTVTYTVVRDDGAVARIGGVYYATLDEAFSAVTGDVTITLVADAELGVTKITNKVTLALAAHNVEVTTRGIDLDSGKLTVTGIGCVSTIPTVTKKVNFVIAGGTWGANPSSYVPEVVTALPGEQSDIGWRNDRYYVFAGWAFIADEMLDVPAWSEVPGYWTVVPLPKAYVTTMEEEDIPSIGAYGKLDCAYRFESFSSENGDDALAATYLNTGDFSEFTSAQIARAKDLLLEKTPFLGWDADFVVSLDGDAEVGDLALSGYYDDWGVWVTYESPRHVNAGEKIRLLTDVGKATPGDWPYANICRFVRTFDCGANMVNPSLAGKTMTVQLRLYKPDEDRGLGSPSILVCEYKYTFGDDKAARIVRDSAATDYATLAEALAEVQSNETIIVLNDFSGNIDLAGCKTPFTIDVNGFGWDVGEVTVTEENWEFRQMSNRSCSYYEKPTSQEDKKTAAMVEVVAENGETVTLSPVTIDEESELYKAFEEETQGTETTVDEFLDQKADNGLKNWQNYVLGQAPTAAVRVDTEQASIEETPVLNTLVETVPPSNSGFTVKYELDKIDVAGNVAEGTPQVSAENFTIDLEDATSNEAGVAYYKLAAVIEAEDGTAKTKVPSENTIGVLAVKDAPATAIIGVPWSSSTDNTSISVNDLVRTANLTPGDELKVFDPVTKTYKMWNLNNDKEWEPVETSSGSGTSDPGEATDSSVARGAGVWLTRQKPEEPIYLVGQAEAAPSETAIDRPTEEEAAAGEKVWNLVASPNVTPVVASAILEEKSHNDKVIIPTRGSPKNIYWNAKKGKWGYVDYVTDPATGYSVPVFVEATEAEIPAGTGFWYLNGDAAADKAKIKW